ncbi:MAG: hypothetical protein IKB93_07965 [Clostridia bacterium]|nr:hypothetical protein [Clostridia bacterium]
MKNKFKKALAFFLCLSLLIGCIPAWAEEALLPPEEELEEEMEQEIEEEIKEEEREDINISEEDKMAETDDEEDETEGTAEQKEEVKKELTEKESVQADKKSLSIGFTRCVSRDLSFPTEGENGTKITWKSDKPEIISNEGKFTCPKQITTFSVTATITKGIYRDEKKFEITANNRTIYDVIKDYADTMVEYGRDTKYLDPEAYMNAKGDIRVNIMSSRTGRSAVGHNRSGMFYSIIKRDTLQYPAYYVDEWPRVGFNSDERGSGCVTSADIWLYELLYELTLLTGDKEYEEVADHALSFFLEHCIHPESGVAAWGKHTPYDPVIGAINVPNQYADGVEKSAWTAYNEPDTGQKYAVSSPFFQQKFFELNPEEWKKHLMSYWESTVSDQVDFTYSRHTYIDGPGSTQGTYAQMWNPMVLGYAWGWHYTGDPEFKEALNSLMNWIERSTGWNKSFMYPQELFYASNRMRDSWSGFALRGIDALYTVIPIVPDDIKERIENFIEKGNTYMDYDPSRGQNSFAQFSSMRTGKPSDYRSLFEANGYTERWAKLADGELKDEMGKWIIDWIDKYAMGSAENLATSSELLPTSITAYTEPIMAVYEYTGDEKYLDRLLELADFSVYAFWQMDGLLPSMSYAQHKYYESTWGSAHLAKEMWNIYFLDIERKTGVNPQAEAWEEAGYYGKNMTYLLGDNTEFFQETRYDLREVEVDEE